MVRASASWVLGCPPSEGFWSPSQLSPPLSFCTASAAGNEEALGLQLHPALPTSSRQPRPSCQRQHNTRIRGSGSQVSLNLPLAVPVPCLRPTRTTYATPGLVDDTITVLAGTTAAGVEGGPSGDPLDFKGDIPASVAGTAAMILMRVTIAAEMRSSSRAARQEVATRPQLRLGIPSHHQLRRSFRRG